MRGQKMSKVNIIDQAERTTELTTRRDFVTWLLGGAIFISALAAVWSVIRFITPPKSAPASPTEAQLVASVDEIPRGAGKQVVFGSKPVWVIQDKKGNYKAFSAICTHLGCIAEWQQDKQIFFCPCHAGVLDENGKVISGPPPRPLPPYNLETKDDRIYITGLKEGERLYGA